MFEREAFELGFVEVWPLAAKAGKRMPVHAVEKCFLADQVPLMAHLLKGGGDNLHLVRPVAACQAGYLPVRLGTASDQDGDPLAQQLAASLDDALAFFRGRVSRARGTLLVLFCLPFLAQGLVSK